MIKPYLSKECFFDMINVAFYEPTIENDNKHTNTETNICTLRINLKTLKRQVSVVIKREFN